MIPGMPKRETMGMNSRRTIIPQVTSDATTEGSLRFSSLVKRIEGPGDCCRHDNRGYERPQQPAEHEEVYQEIDQKHPQNQITGMATVPAFVHAATPMFLSFDSMRPAGIGGGCRDSRSRGIKPAAAVRRRSLYRNDRMMSRGQTCPDTWASVPFFKLPDDVLKTILRPPLRPWQWYDRGMDVIDVEIVKKGH